MTCCLNNHEFSYGNAWSKNESESQAGIYRCPRCGEMTIDSATSIGAKEESK